MGDNNIKRTSTVSTKGKLKKCQKCKQLFPSTSDYFYRSKNSYHRLKPTCKVCSDEKKAKNKIKKDKLTVSKESFYGWNGNDGIYC